MGIIKEQVQTDDILVTKKPRSFDIKTIFTTDSKIAIALNTNLEEHGVYEILCRMYPNNCIGQTNRRIMV